MGNFIDKLLDILEFSDRFGTTAVVAAWFTAMVMLLMAAVVALATMWLLVVGLMQAPWLVGAVTLTLAVVAIIYLTGVEEIE